MPQDSKMKLSLSVIPKIGPSTSSFKGPLTYFLSSFPWPAVTFQTFIILYLDYGGNFLTGVPIFSGHSCTLPNSDPSCTKTATLFSFHPVIPRVMKGFRVRIGCSNMQTPQWSNQGPSTNATHSNCSTIFLTPPFPHFVLRQASLSGAGFPSPCLSSHHSFLIQCPSALFLSYPSSPVYLSILSSVRLSLRPVTCKTSCHD